MSKLNMIKSVANEYGIKWLINRGLYSAKLKMLKVMPVTEKIFEKKIEYPKYVNLFNIDVEALCQSLLGLNEQDKMELIRTANNACEGRIRGFSTIDLDYGNPIDWQLNPITMKRCDINKKWYEIPDFDKECGDIKVIWEASRLSHFITLSRAYLLTDDIKYYRAFSEQIRWWLESNPYSYGANYKCGQECSLRMVNVLLAFSVFKNAGATTDADASNVKELIDRCYRKVLSNFFYAYKCIKNNHTISELMGIIVGAWCSNNTKRLEKGFLMLDEVIDEQFTDDGGYRQFSFNYQRLALQVLECIVTIGYEIGISLSEKSKRKLKAAAYLMYQCQDESGIMPNYGANDGALVFPVTSCEYRDFRPVINTVFALTTDRQLYKSGKHQEELIWFSGKKQLREYKFQNISRKSFQFRKAGLFTLRNKQSWAMVVLNQYNSRPAHLDQLHFDLWIDNENVFCDAGTYSYASELGKQLIQNESHNTVKVYGKKQMKTHGPFLIYDWSKCKLGNCDNNIFEGEMISKNGYKHIRKIECAENEYVIHDIVSGDNECKVIFHTPCEVESNGKTLILSKNGIAICRLVSNGTIDIEKSKYSLYYLNKSENKCISIHSSVKMKEIYTKVEIIQEEKKND